MEEYKETAGAWLFIRLVVLVFLWGCAALPILLFKKEFGFSILSFSQYSTIPHAGPALTLSVAIFLGVAGILGFFLDTKPKDPAQVEGIKILLHSEDPEQSHFALFLLPSVALVTLGAVILAIPLDRFFTPHLEHAFWVWAFWGCIIGAVAATKFGLIFGRRSLLKKFFGRK